MANVTITKQTWASYGVNDHTYHMYKVGDIYQIGNPYMPLYLSVKAIAAGWATAGGAAPTAADIDPSMETQFAQVGAKQKKVVSTDGT